MCISYEVAKSKKSKAERAPDNAIRECRKKHRVERRKVDDFLIIYTESHNHVFLCFVLIVYRCLYLVAQPCHPCLVVFYFGILSYITVAWLSPFYVHGKCTQTYFGILNVVIPL